MSTCPMFYAVMPNLQEYWLPQSDIFWSKSACIISRVDSTNEILACMPDLQLCLDASIPTPSTDAKGNFTSSSIARKMLYSGDLHKIVLGLC